MQPSTVTFCHCSGPRNPTWGVSEQNCKWSSWFIRDGIKFRHDLNWANKSRLTTLLADNGGVKQRVQPAVSESWVTFSLKHHAGLKLLVMHSTGSPCLPVPPPCRASSCCLKFKTHLLSTVIQTIHRKNRTALPTLWLLLSSSSWSSAFLAILSLCPNFGSHGCDTDSVCTWH